MSIMNKNRTEYRLTNLSIMILAYLYLSRPISDLNKIRVVNKEWLTVNRGDFERFWIISARHFRQV